MKAQRKISVIGLGYVGLPVAVAFGRPARVIGFDIDPARVAELGRGVDRTGAVAAAELATADILYTTEPAALRHADFHIVAVPTPVDSAKRPELTNLQRASETLARVLKRGDIVVYESTVYPGATEEECLPVLAAGSGLRPGVDFFVGYSPERINPGDRHHIFRNITKVVSAQDGATLETIAEVYGSVVEAGVHRAPSIKVAEAAKVIENTQRDLNISLMNELALIFHKMGIDTRDVLAAAGSKWNFLPFEPGLVGGHCVGVDPYYLTHKAQMMGYIPQVILAGRNINDGMGLYLAGQVVKDLVRAGCCVKGSRVTVLGLTFKEDVPDLRNSRVVDIVRELHEYAIEVQIHDPLADPADARALYGIAPVAEEALEPGEAVVLAVAHRSYRDRGWDAVVPLLQGGRGLVMDVRGVLPRAQRPEGVSLWRL